MPPVSVCRQILPIAGGEMKTPLFFTGIYILFLAFSVSAQNEDPYRLRSLRKNKTVRNPSFKATAKKNGLFTKADWQALIDARWGEGLSTEQKLQIFDAFWSRIDRYSAAFPNTEVDWSALRDRYRKEVEAGVSRGRFDAIINHMALVMHEGHTYAFENEIHNDTLAPGVPLMVGSPTYQNNHFGAALTLLPDSSLLVYDAIEDHPLGLEPGDRVLGYDGVPWKKLYKELLSYELPVKWLFYGSIKESDEHTWMTAAGENWLRVLTAALSMAAGWQAVS